MSCEEIKISTADELISLFGKAYWVETQFELSTQWAAYISVKEQKYRDVIFKLSHDSEKHKMILEEFFSNIEGLDPEKALENAGLKQEEFDFKRKRDEEIVAELLRYEKLALDIYTKLYEYLDRDLIQEIWKGRDSEDFYE